MLFPSVHVTNVTLLELEEFERGNEILVNTAHALQVFDYSVKVKLLLIRVHLGQIVAGKGLLECEDFAV